MIVVDEDLADAMEKWARDARSLNLAWSQIGRAAGFAWESKTGPLSRDRAAFRSSFPSAPANVENAPGDYAGVYVSAIAQHVLAIAALLDAKQVALSLWPLIRAELEIAGRVVWLLDPGTEAEPVLPEHRVARFQMEILASWCREKFTASKLRNRGVMLTAKASRDHMRSEVECVFPAAATAWGNPGDEKSWTVSGERYVELGAGIDQFNRLLLGDVRGLYDLLSDYSHPSLIRLGTQSRRDDDDSGIAELSYQLESRLLEWQVRLACMILYKSAHLVVGYFGLDDSPLETWADSVPPSWFTNESDE